MPRTDKTITYNWRGIDRDKWARVKMLALTQRISVKELLARAVDEYVTRKA